jgi:siroheme synthase (precorrin-2 oxidase/ferrochelatase)
MTYHRTTEPIVENRMKDEVRMLLPEDLSRIRSNELLDEAHRQRLAREVSAGRWWRWLAEYANKRAEHAGRCS